METSGVQTVENCAECRAHNQEHSRTRIDTEHLSNNLKNEHDIQVNTTRTIEIPSEAMDIDDGAAEEINRIVGRSHMMV